MQEQELQKQLTDLLGEGQLLLDEPMKNHTTFRIGGSARYFAMPESVEQIRGIIACCKEHNEPYFILGNGSNLLVGDKGYDGVMIQLFRNFSDVSAEGECIRAQSGALLSKVAKAALEQELTGFEFAAGIPGTVGGAIVMNAGAYDGEMSQVVQEVTVLDEQGAIRRLTCEELRLGYRTSVLQQRPWVALEVVVRLRKGEAKKIQARMEELRELRVQKQPLEFPSAGSTFKRPEGNYAGKLIMESGLRGYQVGGAKVSDKHCGFVVNAGGATAADVITLTDEVRRKVLADTGIALELEVRKVGNF